MTPAAGTTIAVPTFSLASVATRWKAARVDANDILDWLVAEGFVVPVGTDAFVVTDVGLDISRAVERCRARVARGSRVSAELRTLFSPAVAEAIERLVDERIEAVLASRDNDGDSPWMTLAQAAERLHVSERTVTRMVARGRITTARIGRRVLVNVADLDDAVAGGKRQPPHRHRASQPRRPSSEGVASRCQPPPRREHDVGTAPSSAPAIRAVVP